jgi:hypothetical protein
MDDLFVSLVKRVNSLERRLDDRILLMFNCDVNDSNILYMDICFEKRIPHLLKNSPALTSNITDDDIQSIMHVIRNSLATLSNTQRVRADVSVYRIEAYNLFDMNVKIHAGLLTTLNKHQKIRLYEKVERAFKLKLGDIFNIVNYSANKYDAHILHSRKHMMF